MVENFQQNIRLLSGLFIPSGIHKVIKDLPKISFGNWKPIPNSRPVYPIRGNIYIRVHSGFEFQVRQFPPQIKNISYQKCEGSHQKSQFILQV